MKVTLSIRQYINWMWILERDIDIRKEYRKLSDLPIPCSVGFLPKFVFLNEEEFAEALKVCGSDNPEEYLNTVPGADIDIEWIDDFDYQAKLDQYKEKLDLKI